MTHHAYLYEGPLALLEVLAKDVCERFGFAAHGSPDVRVLSYERFGIEEARALRESAALRSVGGRALFVIGVSSITTEAQQALLKLFEEPQEGTVFVLLTPHGSIIATLRSRMFAYPITNFEHEESVTGAKKFLEMSQKDRGVYIAQLLKNDEGVREEVREFLNTLEKTLYSNGMSSSAEVRQGLADIARVRSYTNDRAPSYKMLLEHLALSLPVVSAETKQKSVRSGPLGQV